MCCKENDEFWFAVKQKLVDKYWEKYQSMDLIWANVTLKELFELLADWKS